MSLPIIKIIKSPAILYIVSRYGTYIIQFINSLFIAIYLGPYYLGIWGFINLTIGYVAQLNFGIPHSVNAIVSINKQNEEYTQKVIANGITMLLLLSIFIVIFFGINLLGGFQIGEKYRFSEFIVPVISISILTHLNVYLSTIFRVYGQVFSIVLYQSLNPILLLLVIPFFRDENLLWAMLLVNCLSLGISLIYFLVKKPVKLTLEFDWSTIKFIQIKGWHLFVYNASFYLILLTTKSFISSNYTVEEFGYFTFSYSLANVVLLLLGSISFLIFPKMLNRFASSTNEEVQEILGSIRVAYISLSHMLIHAVIAGFPLFIYFFPQYQSATDVFRITALTVVLYVNSFGYQALLIARNKERIIGFVAFMALLLNILLCFGLIHFIKVPYSMAIIATMITYFIYVFVLSTIGRKTLGIQNGIIVTLKEIFPIRMILPFFISVFFIIFQFPNLYFILPFIVYLQLNLKELMAIKEIAKKIIKNPNFINI